MFNFYRRGFLLAVVLAASGCQNSDTATIKTSQEQNKTEQTNSNHSFYGTLHPFASEAVYFLMTDRFVDGDSSNNYPEQGGNNKTFNRVLVGENDQHANVGYLGGDFQGILDHADYISKMGFTSIWLSPVVDNPNESFAGGELIEFGGAFKDGGKTGYHGYWGVNFFKIDEHWPSTNLSFKQLTHKLREQYGIKTVLDIVTNHGSPSFDMKPVDQPMFGEIYDADENLIADHQNLAAEKLDENNPLHTFYNHKTEIVQLSDVNEDNPEVLEYFVKAYLYWIDEGADAFRVDTLKHMPHGFWKKFTDRIRLKHPDFFMFGESYSYEADFIGQHTQEENGDISVLDFPGQKTITEIFEDSESDYNDIQNYLYLEDSPYKNVYELMTFYDNHDMQRMAASNNGFIDAHNWLFTSRGIPVIYYGSESAFMSGTKEHMGNRNYFGNENIAKAKNHPIQKALTQIANIRKSNIALQKGLQLNLYFSKNIAAFYRIYEYQGKYQTALVLLNKGDSSQLFSFKDYLSSGQWENAETGLKSIINKGDIFELEVSAHNVTVMLLNEENKNFKLREKLTSIMTKN